MLTHTDFTWQTFLTPLHSGNLNSRLLRALQRSLYPLKLWSRTGCWSIKTWHLVLLAWQRLFQLIAWKLLLSANQRQPWLEAVNCTFFFFYQTSDMPDWLHCKHFALLFVKPEITHPAHGSVQCQGGNIHCVLLLAARSPLTAWKTTFCKNGRKSMAKTLRCKASWVGWGHTLTSY